MRKTNLTLLLGVMVVIILITGACLPRRQSTSQPTASTGQSSTGGSQSSGSESGGGETSPQASSNIEGVPEDVPIMQGAYKVQVARGGANVVYQVDTDIQTVVQFYQDQLPGMGWEMAGPPDNVVGSIATMLRQNEDGERMTVNMQENSIGGFVQVTIAVVHNQ